MGDKLTGGAEGAETEVSDKSYIVKFQESYKHSSSRELGSEQGLGSASACVNAA